MKIELTKEDIDILCDLVFLGDWLINSLRLPADHIEKYKKFSKKAERLHRHILSPEEQKHFDNDELQFYLDKLENYIDEYDNESCFPTLAIKLAQANYPENPQSKNYYDSIHIQLDAMEIYRKELVEKGTSILSVDISDIEDRLEVCRLALKKRTKIKLS